VLPLQFSSDPEQEYFSDGLTEEILNQLAQVKALRLTVRTSSFAFKGKNEDLRVIGEKLGVANLLEGSVRKAGNELRITAQLINAADGTNRWSKTYVRKLEDVFAVQEQIARDVASALSITLDVGSFSRAAGGTNSIEAYDKFLLALPPRASSVRTWQRRPDSTVRPPSLIRRSGAPGLAWHRRWPLFQCSFQTGTAAPGFMKVRAH
jgi:TolB-like protein